MFGGALQPMHLILILIIALVVFGPGKLPELGSSLGKTLKEFRQSMSEASDTASTAKAVEAPKADDGDAQPKS